VSPSPTEFLSIQPVDGRVEIQGFPDAVKSIRLTSKKGRRLADLSLHQIDLQFAVLDIACRA